MSNPNPPATRRAARRWHGWAGWIALAIYGAFLWGNFSNVAGGADSSGYLNSARLLAAGKLAGELRTPPEFGPQMSLWRQQFQPHGFAPFEGNARLSPTYAVGLPLHLALAGKLFGWSHAAGIVGVGAALAALWLCHAAGRALGLEFAFALTGAVVLAAYPVFLFTSIQPLSDTLATTWCLAAVLTALRARSNPTWALACGVAVAMAVLIRATNVLLLPAIVALLGFNVRRLGFAFLGGVPFAVWLGYYNHTLYGGALRSGYVNISEGFSWPNVVPTVVHFAKWLALLMPALLLALPFAALFRREGRGRELLALALWFGAIVGVYLFYDVSQEVWWCLRFILPATPVLILGGMLGLQLLIRGNAETPRPWLIGIATAGLARWAVGLGWHWTKKLHVLLIPVYEQAYADAAHAARAQFPPGALVVSGLHSGALYYYTDFAVLRWELVKAEEFAGFRQKAENAGRPICAVLFDVEEVEALQKKCAGPWEKIGAVRNVGLWRLNPATGAKSE